MAHKNQDPTSFLASNRAKAIIGVLIILLFAILCALPEPSGLSRNGKISIIIMLAAILTWVFEVIPIAAASIFFTILPVILGIAPLPMKDDGLWRLDWTQTSYEALAAALPHEPPPFPTAADMEERYALCRLLLLHPAPLQDQPMALNRRVIKLTGESLPRGAISEIHQTCAALLRQGKPLPSLAGGVISKRLQS